MVTPRRAVLLERFCTSRAMVLGVTLCRTARTCMDKDAVTCATLRCSDVATCHLQLVLSCGPVTLQP